MVSASMEEDKKEAPNGKIFTNNIELPGSILSPLNMLEPVLLFQTIILEDGCIAGYTTDGAPRRGRADHILAPGVDVSLATYTQRCASGRQPGPTPCREHCRFHQEPHQDDAGLLQRVRLFP